MDIEPPSGILLFCFQANFILFTSGILISFVLLAILILSSALISGSEIAFFSLSPNDMAKLRGEDQRSSKLIVSLKEKPRTLLATILICNNLVNIAIVIVSDYLIKKLVGPDTLNKMGQWLYDAGLNILGTVESLALGFNLFITVVVVTFILVLFGEIAPKIYANLNNMRFARFMAGPLTL